MKTKIDHCHAADSKPVKQEVDGKVILPPLVFPVFIVQATRLAVFEDAPLFAVSLLPDKY
jgi:hypothetical protein